MDDLWIMLIDSTNYLSRNGIENTSSTIDYNGKMCYTKRAQNHSQETSIEAGRHQGQLSDIQILELHELIKNIDPDTPERLWEGIVTDSSPATLTIFNNGHFLRSHTYYAHQRFESNTNPQTEHLFRLIDRVESMRQQILDNNSDNTPNIAV